MVKLYPNILPVIGKIIYYTYLLPAVYTLYLGLPNRYNANRKHREKTCMPEHSSQCSQRYTKRVLKGLQNRAKSKPLSFSKETCVQHKKGLTTVRDDTLYNLNLKCLRSQYASINHITHILCSIMFSKVRSVKPLLPFLTFPQVTLSV